MQEKDLYILKIGTNTLVDDKGAVRDELMSEILKSAKKIMEGGHYVLIVSSGAARLGRIYLKDEKVSTKIASSVGQPLLFNHYMQSANKLGVTIAEILLTKPYIAKREQFLNLQETFNEMFERGILPIVNENDVLVFGSSWSFDGNDPLACDLAISLGAKKLFLITNTDGLYTGDPSSNPLAKFIPEVENITEEIFQYCSRDIAENSTGGMLSKLKVARIASVIGIETRIVNGLVAGNIDKALAGDEIGTLFHARKIDDKVSNRDRWILVAKNSAGSIEVDDGAVKALKSGMSLLAVGVKRIFGKFQKGQVIEVIDKNSQGIAFGIVDYSHDEILELIGSSDIKDKQLIHTDNMFIL
ncbi:MAG: Glutamate 5-kinase [Patescibacteria group bacterium]|nr:Glutamate 5-kinase [Patescibacteria group bacterium]